MLVSNCNGVVMEFVMEWNACISNMNEKWHEESNFVTYEVLILSKAIIEIIVRDACYVNY